MAIFWNHIKGTSNATSSHNGLWTWITWSPTTLSEKWLPTNVQYVDVAPHIQITNQNDQMHGIADLGTICTTNLAHQFIQHDIATRGIFNQGLYFYDLDHHWDHADVDGFIKCTFKDCNLNVGVKGTDISFVTNYTKVDKENGIAEYTSRERFALGVNKVHLTGNLIADAYDPETSLTWTINGDIKVKNINSEGNTTITGLCQAQWFNALSDRRAKENVQKVTDSALDWINNACVYSFNYINHPNKLTLGMMAQEVQQHPFNNVSLVDNIDADGKNNNFMTLEESKIIYILVKAIQEQEQKIQHLEEELQRLADHGH